MKALSDLVEQTYLRMSPTVIMTINGKTFLTEKAILQNASETIKDMLSGDSECKKITWDVDEKVEIFIIQYLKTGLLDQDAIVQNPQLIPRLICEGLKLNANPMIQILLKYFSEDQWKFFREVYNSQDFHEGFIPLEFVMEHFDDVHPRLVYGRDYISTNKSAHLKAFAQWIEKSSDSKTNQFYKKLITPKKPK